jgi:hypothetical protein
VVTQELFDQGRQPIRRWLHCADHALAPIRRSATGLAALATGRQWGPSRSTPSATASSVRWHRPHSKYSRWLHDRGDNYLDARRSLRGHRQGRSSSDLGYVRAQRHPRHNRGRTTRPAQGMRPNGSANTATPTFSPAPACA